MTETHPQKVETRHDAEAVDALGWCRLLHGRGKPILNYKDSSWKMETTPRMTDCFLTTEVSPRMGKTIQKFQRLF